MNLVSGFFNRLYMPVCRRYSRMFVKDKPANKVYRLLCSIQFRRVHGFWPNFVRPKRFTEKLWSRMLHDRRDWLTMVSDKERVRPYVAEKIGVQYLIPILWKGADPEMIPFDDLPSAYVIKANHGCGYNIIVKDKSRIDAPKIRTQLKTWLNTNYCEEFALGIEWGYRNIKPSIIIESFIGENGQVPEDYKFFCFSGRVEFMTRHFNRFENHLTKAFDRDFKSHEFRSNYQEYCGECKRPKNYGEMVNIAESLAKDFSFIRVDLYNISGRIFFGELTPYHGGVTTPCLPASLDASLGEKWHGS